MKDKLETAERGRVDDMDALRSQCREETATLTQRNEELTRSVAAPTQQVTALTWKSFRRPNDSSAVLLASSIIREVDADKLHDTAAICNPGATIETLRKEIGKLPKHGHDHITLVVGRNDCAAHIVDDYAALIDASFEKAHEVTVSGICPRLKPADLGQHIDAVNARLVSLCAEKGATFADNTPPFTLRDGNVNDGYLTPDGDHITNTAVNRVAQNLKLRVKDTAQGVCKATSKKRAQAAKPASNDRRDQNGQKWTGAGHFGVFSVPDVTESDDCCKYYDNKLNPGEVFTS